MPIAESILAPSADTNDPGSGSLAWTRGRIALLCLSLLFAYLPLVWIEARFLWDQPQHQSFPLVLLGALYLLKQRSRGLGKLQPGSLATSYLCFGGAASLLALGVWTGEQRLASLSALTLFLLTIYAVGGGSLVRTLLPVWLLLWLVVPLPAGLDRDLILFLQKWTAGASSFILDKLGVFHVPEGSVVCIPGKRLFVDEACSGIQSLYSGLAFTAFLLLLQRRRLFHSLLLLAATLVLILAANVARVSGVALFEANWHIEASTGWRHQFAGWLAFFAALVLIVSTDSLLLFLLGRPIPFPQATKPKAAEPAEATQWPDFDATPLAAWPITVLLALLAVVQVPTWWAAATDPNALQSTALPTRLGEEALPAEWGAWKRVGYDFRERESSSQMGQFSQFWRYQRPGAEVVVSLDYPYPNLHDLTVCYRMEGHALLKRKIEWPADTRPFVAAELLKGTDKRLWLWFSGFDARGTAFPRQRPLPRDPSAGPSQAGALGRCAGRFQAGATWHADR